MTPKGSLPYRAIRRLLGEVSLTKIWEYLSAYYLWHAFPLNGKSLRLFQIVGVPRSGTTLLCGLLASHSRVICLSEPLLKNREARGDIKALQGGIIENKLSEYTKYLNQNEVDYIEKECGELMQIMGYL